MQPLLVYLHGFNSSAQSTKARQLAAHMASLGLADRYLCPSLPHLPNAAMQMVDDLLAGREGEKVCFVGSSLGGFYATHLAQKHQARAVLINPAIDPHLGLRAYLGPQRNLYSGEAYELTYTHLDQWQTLCVDHIEPQRYLLLVETGDEVLDYRQAVARYAGAEQRVIEGGDHSLRSFPEHLPRLLAFAGWDGTHPSREIL